MSTLQTICVGIFLMAYYFFVLRKYNTLGFRLFSLFFFTSIAVCYWWYIDYADLKDVEKNGVAAEAVVLKKSADNLEFRFTDQTGNTIVRTQTGGISVEEFASVSQGKPAPVLYSRHSDVIYLKSSYQRQLSDNIYILFFPGLLFLIGCLCWIFLRKYRVHAHGDGSIYEYVTDENGKVVLDDAQSSTTKSLRNYTTFSKLFDIFGK
ncbi:hypothetical protein LZD49_31315 [Dyadobacter sp. CY261]|uniref:hypothetical protein n=1 Tax=Dyadobacter sp. CY261 TaxID=2907203 RepID=UPI001F286D6F|nr:hypothetical protein [Dyadobacter sp. CY261]MCF0075016.1 hypothetical protein [Dyadobacter sp. CY261]